MRILAALIVGLAAMAGCATTGVNRVAQREGCVITPANQRSAGTAHALWPRDGGSYDLTGSPPIVETTSSTCLDHP